MLADQGGKCQEISKSMDAVNPCYNPRNHQVESAIQGALEGDLTVFEDLNSLLKNPYDIQEGVQHYSLPPRPEEEVANTFCGT